MPGIEVRNEPFNEKNPFGKSTVVGGDSIEFSRDRWAATQAMVKGNATPAQAALVRETDRIIQEALAIRQET